MIEGPHTSLPHFPIMPHHITFSALDRLLTDRLTKDLASHFSGRPITDLIAAYTAVHKALCEESSQSPALATPVPPVPSEPVSEAVKFEETMSCDHCGGHVLDCQCKQSASLRLPDDGFEISNAYTASVDRSLSEALGQKPKHRAKSSRK